LKLNRVAFYGRTFFEYLLFFNLTLEQLKKYPKIIDCPSGASSFVAEINDYVKNAKVVGCYPLFDKSLDYLKRKGQEDILYVVEKVKSTAYLYNWSYYRTLENLTDHRKIALHKFLLDYRQGQHEHRYIKANLPELPFEDKSFDLVLNGHFLFTYANKFDFEFHVSSILELFRISSKEVRIYPIQEGSLKPYSFMNELISELKGHGIDYEILKVPFEFQRGSNKVLRLIHN
jgi:hypothetical protein